MPREDTEEKGFFRQVLPSVIASLIIAMIMGFITFVGTFSRIDTNNNLIERRVRNLEDESKDRAKTLHDLQLTIARLQVVLESAIEELKDEKARHQQLQQNLSRFQQSSQSSIPYEPRHYQDQPQGK